MRGRQSVKKGIWHIGGRRSKQKRGAPPLGLLAGLAGPVLGEIAKPIFGKIFGRGLRRKKGLRRRRIRYR